MIAKAAELHPSSGPSASQIARRKNRLSRLAGLKTTREYNRQRQELTIAPKLKGSPSNKSLKQARAAECAEKRWSKNKADRLARRPRTVVVDVKKAKVIRAATLVIGVLAGIAQD